MTAGHSDEPGKLSSDHIVEKAQKVWDGAPQPVKSFPWSTAVDNFIQLILDLAVAVVKYLSLPVFFVTSISELSYCAHERKLYVTLFPFLIGAAVAGLLGAAAVESSPSLRLEVCHVMWMDGIFFFIFQSWCTRFLVSKAEFRSTMAFNCPSGSFHFAQIAGPLLSILGTHSDSSLCKWGIVRTLWFAFKWYRIPKIPSESTVADSGIRNGL